MNTGETSIKYLVLMTLVIFFVSQDGYFRPVTNFKIIRL